MPRERVTKSVGSEAELFGQRLREKRRLTQAMLAAAGQLSLTYLSDMERGLKVPSLTTLARLAVALDCKMSALVTIFDNADCAHCCPIRS